MKNKEFDVPDFLDRAAENIGCTRERYLEKNIPTCMTDVVIMPYFGDPRHTFVLSSLLLKNYIKKIRRPRYFVLLSQASYGGLYPYVDEYWSLSSQKAENEIVKKLNGYCSNSNYLDAYETSILRYFRGEFLSSKDLIEQYYKNTFTKKFFDDYKNITYNLPALSSVDLNLNKRLTNLTGNKVLIYPCMNIKGWSNNKEIQIPVEMIFWTRLIQALLDNGFEPVIWQDSLCYDVSPTFADRCTYIVDKNILSILGVMRNVGCVLDIFSGISRYALMARTPFIAADDRQRYFQAKDFELDDLCGKNIPKKNIFMVPNFISSSYQATINRIIMNLEEFIVGLDRTTWDSSGEIVDNILDVSDIREKKIKKIGLNFIKVEKL